MTWRLLFPLGLLGLVLAFSGCTTNRVPQNSSASGIVVDTQGHPVADASIEIYRHSMISSFLPAELELKGTTHTDSHGVFQFSYAPGGSILLVRAPTLAPTWRTPWRLDPDDLPLVFTVTKPATIEGIVVDEHDQPIADADVWTSQVTSTTLLGEARFSLDILSGQPAHELFHTRTGSDGRFRLEGLPTGAGANLTVTKTGLAMREPTPDPGSLDFNQCQSGQSGVKLVMEPSGEIQGKIFIQATAQPLAGATIWLRRQQATYSFDQGREPVKSAADGTFHFSDVGAGPYQVIAHVGAVRDPMPKWVADAVDVSVQAGQKTSVEIPAVKGGILEIKVTDKSNHKPLAGALVAADNRNFQANITTDARGLARFRLPSGEYHYSAMKAAWTPAQEQARVANAEINHSHIELTPPKILTGVVRTPSGDGAPNIRVTVDAYGGEARTDSRGRFKLTWNPTGIGGTIGIYSLIARDWTNNLAAVAMLKPTTTNQDLVLKSALTLSGQVNDNHGHALAGARVGLTLSMNDSSDGTFRTSSTDFDKIPMQTDADGQFMFTTLPQGLEYGLNISAKGYGSITQDFTKTQTKANAIRLDLVLKPANLKLSGRVVDAKDHPLAGASVYISGEGQTAHSVKTDPEGHFEFEQVSAGPVHLSAIYEGHFGSLSAQGGDQNVVIKITSGQPGRTRRKPK
ncbi:MAG TPA: carboxypeptidase regulatory-like domain-containing protein [Verrucomicrobiae bacterium]|jgi:protocatechuate 3,4-dioxygenase beta subunit|nr:carboxypeptidase regulatory-like domain-containing protein [Verrucomicrobiae bacterium]